MMIVPEGTHGVGMPNKILVGQPGRDHLQTWTRWENNIKIYL
jgi:hypothetical protein